MRVDRAETQPRMGAPASWRQLPLWVVALIAVCCAVEAIIILLTVTGMPEARQIATVYGAFWSQLVNGSLLPVYAGQPLLMVVTYGLLHGGVLHLAMNMVSLAVVARELTRLIGSGPMAMVYVVSQVAAAGLFALMSPEAGPMVGASGAIFGLAGALVVVVAARRREMGQPMGPLWRAVANIVALNLGLMFLVPNIAWQAHLGGAIAGVVLGLLLNLRRQSRLAKGRR
ncbi:rhomboid family intramembrane serine protease [Paracoccus tegillarcae]|uniref:Rhomboid family intramembrane serine protease n=1 Tax=Paracoccus tegillarcae TaxID=1529068 RepID=A0A2K9EZ50_9RHOB|nr:rhomboid family intramembrane serine protease [Paracoccus tegillarcae]